MLSVKNVSAGYGRKIVVRDVTMRVAEGEFVGLIGPNGSGKTTLLRVISGVLAPSEGEVLLRDAPLRTIGKRRLAQMMACLPQELASDLAFTVREIVLMGRSPHLSRIGRETRQDSEAAEKAMALADIADIADRFMTEISGGERQRAFIAMCLAQEPQILLLDEPTSHLDVGHQLSLLDLVKRLNRRTGMTVVAVFHDLNLASEYCDRLLLLHQGRAEALGSPQEVLTAEIIRRVYQAKVLTEPNLVSGKPHIVISAGKD
ncbi:MAG: ABC transporter ATP-binding protein [Candidatus Brocadiia bacterium]